MTETLATRGSAADADLSTLLAAAEDALREAYRRGYDDGHRDGLAAAARAEDAIDAWVDLEAPAATGTIDAAVDAAVAASSPAAGFWFDADVAESPGFGTFHKVRPGVVGDWPRQVRVEANRTLTNIEVDHLGHLLSYAWAATVHGDPTGRPARDSSRSFVVTADTTTSHRSDPMAALATFADTFEDYVAFGTPIRRTDRAGVGTKGTRAVDPVDDPRLTVTVYYDRVTAAD